MSVMEVSPSGVDLHPPSVVETSSMHMWFAPPHRKHLVTLCGWYITYTNNNSVENETHDKRPEKVCDGLLKLLCGFCMEVCARSHWQRLKWDRSTTQELIKL